MLADTPEQKAVSPNAADTHAEKSEEKTANTGLPVSSESDVVPPVSNARAAKRKKKCCLEWGKFAVEVLTLIVISIYTCIAYHQWQEMIKATEAARVGAEAAENAANVAKTGVEQTRNEMEEDRRAWIGVSSQPPINYTGRMGPDQKILIEFTINVSNSGRTVANNIRYCFDLDIRPAGIMPDTKCRRPKIGFAEIPGGSFPYVQRRDFPRPEADAVTFKKSKFYAIATILYTVSGKEHVTEYCATDTDGNLSRPAPCTFHNNAD